MPLSLHKLREKLYLQELMLVNSGDASRKWSAFIHAYMRNKQSVHCAHWVLAPLVYALLASHKRYLWPASVQSETSLYREYVWTMFFLPTSPFLTHHVTGNKQLFLLGLIVHDFAKKKKKLKTDVLSYPPHVKQCWDLHKVRVTFIARFSKQCSFIA